MKKLLFCFAIMAWSLIVTAQRSIAVIGASTASGKGATAGNGWVALTSNWLKSKGLIDTIYNLAVVGYTSWDIAATGSSYPDGADAPDTSRNVTKALSYQPFPKVVLVSVPINDLVNGFTVTQYLSNLRTIYKTVTDNGGICFITTTQPTNYSSLILRKNMRAAADSILLQFPHNSFNFFDTLENNSAKSDSLELNSDYNSGDGIHPNDAGHLALFQQVAASTDFMAAFLLNLGSPSVLTHALSTVQIGWQASHVDSTIRFIIQRGTDSLHFTDLASVTGKNAVAAYDLSYTDASAPVGTSYYRIHATGDGQDTFSTVLSYYNPGKLGLSTPVIGSHSFSTVEIDWQADHVDNTVQFYIQRGSDSLQATDIGQVTGVNSLTAQSFSFTDAAAPVGASYYRIHASGNGQELYSAFVRYYNPGKLSVTRPTIGTHSLSTVQIGWQAENADSAVEFFIQRGADSLQAVNVGSLMGMNGNVTQNFSFTDTSAPVGSSYYRIHATGNDQDVYSSFVSYYNAGPGELNLTTPVIKASSLSIVQLGWKAEHVDSSVEFYVQRGTDSLQLADVGETPGANSETAYDFAFTDTSAPVGTSYYRIRAIHNGQVLYSPEISYYNPGKSFGLVRLYSVAGSSEIVAEIASSKDQTMTLSVYNLSGKLMLAKQIYVTEPSTRQSVSIPGIPAGVYFVKLADGSGQKDSRAFVKF